MSYSARREMKGKTKDGEYIDIAIQIGIPYESQEYNSWACPILVSGLHENLAETHGIDSWQSIQLAQKTIKSILRSFIEKGGELYIFGENEKIKLEEVDEFF